jgi:Tfp pilus assembly protein PilV
VLRTAFLNEKGTSLIEILISIFLTAVVFTGLLQSSLLAVNANVENLLRDEAVAIAEQRMSEARDMSFNTLASDAVAVPILRNFRGITGFQFNRQMTVTSLDTNNNQVVIRVQWTRKNITHTHTITTVVRRPGT